ncbi:MAG: DEAD/DEAH box helicase family protein [Pseudomonadales bacterium]|nr:DEAD/DEAH box helicase family protein [Pseudomonadales bacterium]
MANNPLVLRQWQAEAINGALRKFRTGGSHYLCLATPGAGKTVMASMLAKQLLEAGLIDLVFCFTPSVTVSASFKATLEAHLAGHFDGLVGSKGHIFTYHSMLNLDDRIWHLLKHQRVLVIFDEIHHCAGDAALNANAWGQTILQNIQGRATYTLALTGTPWRSDKIPIVLTSYCEAGVVKCDYQYGLDKAIQDRVCRVPQMIAVDNEAIVCQQGDQPERYPSIASFLEHSGVSYQQLLHHDALIRYVLQLGQAKLMNLRRHQANAGGLIVAASVAHAQIIARLLHEQTGHTASIATYHQRDAQGVINDFRESDQPWIISVGMISEGTDIPRLRVCCHLTRVKTELYFRQVLGRILRSTSHRSEKAYLYLPAEPHLLAYAERVEQDVPEENAVMIHTMDDQPITLPEPEVAGPPLNPSGAGVGPSHMKPFDTSSLSFQPTPVEHTPTNERGSESAPCATHPVSFFGKFRERVIRLSLVSH